MTTDVRGTVVGVGETRTVSTQYGERDLAELDVRVESEERVTVTLWGKWTETAAHAREGMDLLVTGAKETEFRGEAGYATSGDSHVVLEPGFLVDVTDIRSWVQCPRMYYLNKLKGVPLAAPVTKGTIVHEVFGDLLRGRGLEGAVEERVEDAALELGLLGESPAGMREEVAQHAGAIDGWLKQGVFADDAEGGWAEDDWRSEYTLISPTYGIKGRADALRGGMPVELKTGKNTNRDPRFQDKIQAACYALLLEERGHDVNTGTLLYTKNAAVDRAEESGDLSPAKEFSLGDGLLDFVVRTRNEIAAMEYDTGVPTGHEADARCEYCFERDACMVVAGRLDQESKAGTVGTALPEAEREYFEEVYERIEGERASVHREYAKLWRQTPEERVDDDRAVLGLEPLDRERTDDGRWRLTAERSDAETSKLRAGDVALGSDGDPVYGERELVRVEELDAERVVVTADEPFALRRLDVYPSELSVDRMLTALHDAVLAGDPDRKAVLFGDRDPEFERIEADHGRANESQAAALDRALGAEDFALVHGPPGTGKTYTIARLVRELVSRGERVLLAAFTNRAVDNALEALRDQGYEEALRMGTATGVREDMRDLRLENQSGDPAETLTDARVVAATTATCGSRVMREQSFDVAVVDEASQLTEPDTLAAVARADRFVLVGDHHQLPPVVRNEDLGTSLFERLHDAHPESAVMLDTQYRMAQRIQAFSSREFYDGALRPASADVATQTLADLGVDVDRLPAELRDPVAFVDTPGDDGRHTDAVEADRVASAVDVYLDAGVDPEDVGVIAPFRAQVTELSRRLPDGVVADTVDRFQGSAKEVILVSFVATASLDGPLFEDYRRLNVALTRAKKALVLVGDERALRSDPLYGRMVDWAT